MFKAGEVYLNPVTGERAVIRIGTDLTGGERMVVDVYVQPGGRVMGEHIHPEMEERFVMLRGKVGFRLAGRVSIAEPGVELMAPPGTPHDWWNAGTEEALVRMEMRPAARFEAMIRNAFGLAQDGKVNKVGMPNVLQLAVFAREFSDVMEFTRPPRFVQKILCASISANRPCVWSPFCLSSPDVLTAFTLGLAFSPQFCPAFLLSRSNRRPARGGDAFALGGCLWTARGRLR